MPLAHSPNGKAAQKNLYAHYQVKQIFIAIIHFNHSCVNAYKTFNNNTITLGIFLGLIMIFFFYLNSSVKLAIDSLIVML